MPSIKDSYIAMKSTFDFSAVLLTMQRTNPEISGEEGAELLDAFLQWISLAPLATKDDPIQMLESVDQVWHAFILNTRAYREFCLAAFGRFIDHDALDPLVRDRPRGKYARHTLALLRAEFGQGVNPRLLDLLSEVTCCVSACHTSEGDSNTSDHSEASMRLSILQ